MRKRIYKIIIITGILMALISGCTTRPEIKGGADDFAFEGKVMSATELALTECRDEDMELVGSDEQLKLFVNMTSGEFRVETVPEGKKWYSNPVLWKDDPIASSSTKERLGSQLIIDYYDSERVKRQYSSYNDSFKHGQIRISKIKNGVRADYLMGLARSKLYCPEIVRSEFMDQLSALLSEEDKRTLMKRYRYFNIAETDDKTLLELENSYPGIRDQKEVYVVRSLGLNIRKEIGEQFGSIGWNQEDFLAERELFGYPEGEKSSAVFLIPVEYKIDNGTFTAEILSEEIKFQKGYTIGRIDLLPYFASTAYQEEGFILLPDGSGALLDLTSSTKYGYTYSQPVYGKDMAITQTLENNTFMQVFMPIFGISSSRGGVFSIIEGAAPNAFINSEISGDVSSVDHVWASFHPTAMDYLSYDGLMSVDGTYVFANSFVKERFRVRYSFIDKPDPRYTDMAVLYRNRLIADSKLKPSESEATVPVYLDLIGMIDKRETLLGVPYRARKPLTTFAQAEIIAEELIKNGVNNIAVRYTGWANGGVNNTLPDSIVPERVLGGKKGMNSFIDYCAVRNIGLYPDFDMVMVRKNTVLDGFIPFRNAARLITRKIASRYPVLKSTGKKITDKAVYILNTATVQELIRNNIKQIGSQKVTGVSMSSLGYNLSGDYKYSANTTRTESASLINAALKESVSNASNEVKVILDGANMYLIEHASGLMNIPMVSSKMLMASAEIPFYSMVLSGCIPFSGPPLNLSGDITNAVLDSAQVGAGLHFKWIYEDNDSLLDTSLTDDYSLNYSVWIDQASGIATKYNDDLKSVLGKSILDHESLGEGVYRTTFEGGWEVYVNYSESQTAVDDIVIPAGSYSVKRGD